MDRLLLTRSEIAALPDSRALLAALREAFVAYSTRRAVDAMRVPVPLPCRSRATGRRCRRSAPVPGGR